MSPEQDSSPPEERSDMGGSSNWLWGFLYAFTWICPFGPLVSWLVARYIMGLSAFQQTINLGPLRSYVAPFVWPIIIFGLCAPFLGILIGLACMIGMDSNSKKGIEFPWMACLLLCLVGFFLYYII